MARLAISLIGPFQATLDGEPVTGFKANKVRALLAYLAVEARQPQPRSVLAALLWPDWADRAALGNLRFALSTLRQAIGDPEAEPPFLLIHRDTIQLNPRGATWLDIAAFNRHIADSAHQQACHADGPAARLAAIRHLEAAVALYRGPFLEGFSVGDSPAFEEWARRQAQHIDRRLILALQQLSTLYDQEGQYADAERCARRQLELDALNEVAHRQLMRALTLGGQRGAALAHYETCRHLLQAEVGAEPEDATTVLYERIRVQPEGLEETSVWPGLTIQTPVSLALASSAPPPLFVARERELAWLDGQLERALQGAGRVVFVVGDVGSGKTALLDEFARRALGRHPEVVVARGKGDVYSGLSDRYLPFHHIVHDLTDNPVALAHPLILLLDDLQWADTASIHLLFHLGRDLDGRTVLVVGAYRQEDIAPGVGWERHPLAAVVHELQREFGDIELDLNQADGRLFIDALLDSEPNRLAETFRETLYLHTEGHPLFTVELLRRLQEGGDLVRDEVGRWVEGEALDWETLPPRIEAVIAERVERLPCDWQAMLSAASVEGEEFTAEVVARAQGLEEREVIRRLSGVLSHVYHLVQGQGWQWVGDHRLSRYRFRHSLFRHYLYSQLDEPERAQLHDVIGSALEAVCAAREDELVRRAPQLAWHFAHAGRLDKATHYLCLAGDQAMRLSPCEGTLTH